MGHGVSLLDDPAGQNAPVVVQLAHVTSAAVVAPAAFVPNLPAGQVAVHDVAREQPAPLCRPAGQSAQALHWPQLELHMPQYDRPVSYCPAPHPVFP